MRHLRSGLSKEIVPRVTNQAVGPIEPGAGLCSWHSGLVVFFPEPGLIDSPIVNLIDHVVCRQKHFDPLRPDDFDYCHCGARDGLNIHLRSPDSAVVDHRCQASLETLNMFPDELWRRIEPILREFWPRNVT